MDLHDKVFIKYLGGRGYPNEEQQFIFSDDENSAKPLEIQENGRYAIRFLGFRGDKLYLDGLDLLSNSRIKEDEDGRFIFPNGHNHRGLDLYEEQEYGPDRHYLPGSWRLKLVLASGEVKYSWLEVRPKFLTGKLLDKMRYEVESKIVGLARAFDENMNGPVTNHSDVLKPEDVLTLKFLHRQQAGFLRSIYEVGANPRTVLQDQYQWTNQMAVALDGRGVQQMAAHPERGNQIYGKVRRVSYLSRDNIILKSQLTYLYRKVHQLIRQIEEIMSRPRAADYVRQRQDDFQADLDVLNTYQNNLLRTLSQPWMQAIPDRHLEVALSGSLMNPNYLFFREAAAHLERVSKEQTAFHQQYHSYWLRTEKLYEFWGFIKILESLERLGFRPISGWIFDSDREQYDMLEPGTAVKLTRVNGSQPVFNLRVVYDEPIPQRPSDTDRDHPIWISSPHNRPDFRIDIFDQQDTLLSTIVLDTKYRSASVFMKSRRASGAWEQLTGYLDSIKSDYTYGSDKYDYFIDPRHQKSIVQGVGVIYPGELDDSAATTEKIANAVDSAKSESLTPIEMTPDTGDAALDTFLKKCFADLEVQIHHFLA